MPTNLIEIGCSDADARGENSLFIDLSHKTIFFYFAIAFC